MAENVRKFRTEGGINGGGKSELEFSSKGNIRKSDALRCKECTGSKVLFQECESGIQALLENSVNLEGCLSRTKLEKGR